MPTNKISPAIIDQYLKNGKNLTILAGKDGKEPILKEWTKKTLNRSELLNHNGNLGWALDHGDLVVDVDPRNGGEASFAKLLSDLNIKLTPTVNTPSGGFHCYLRVITTEDIKFSKKLKGYEGIDFLSKGAQCVISGSRSKKGSYRWSDELVEFEQTDAPQALVDLISKDSEDKAANEDLDDFGGLIGSDYGTTEEQVVKLLNSLDPSMGNDDWVRIGMALHNWHPIDGLRLWEEWSKEGKNYQKGETEKRWKSFKTSGGVTLGTLVHMYNEANGIIEWEAPILFDEYETPKIPADILPSPLKEFAKNISYSMETPEEMAIMAILAVVSTALQKKFEVVPKENGGYKETINIYTLTALPPANRKSSIVRACEYPIIEWEKEQRIEQEPEIRKQQSIYESRKRIVEAQKKNLKPGDDLLIQKIAEEEAKLVEPKKLPQLVTNDVTPEGLSRLMSEQNGKMAIFSDEGGIVDTMAGLYSGGKANIDILLKGWDGGYISLRRKDADFSMNPLLTINLTVQPVIIQNLGDQKAYTGKGLLERFLYCLPKSNLGYRTHDKGDMSPHVKHAYNQKIRYLLSIPYNDFPRILTLDKEAYQEWHQFQLSTEIELRPYGLLASCQGWGGKICGYALRIAALLHVVSYGEERRLIDKNTVKKSLQLCALLKQHAIAAFGLMNTDPDRRDAIEILKWILENNLESFSKSQLTKRMQNRKNMEAARLDKLLVILSQRSIISHPIKEGKKTIYFKVNPAIFSKKKEEEKQEAPTETYEEDKPDCNDGSDFDEDLREKIINLFENISIHNQKRSKSRAAASY